MTQRDIEHALREEVGRVLQEPAERIDMSRSLSELGMDSVGYCAIAAFTEKAFKVPVKPETLYEFSSIQETAAHIAELVASPGGPAQPAAEPQRPRSAEPSARPPRSETYSDRDVAIIGTSVRLPGARSLGEYWSLILRGESMLREFPAERWPAGSSEGATAPGHLKGGFIDDVDAFDAAFFGISPREAVAMDPQQRLMLECAWHAFEDAGYRVDRISGSDTAVFVGASSFDYYELLTRSQSARTTHMGTGVSHAILANRISQHLNLRGASEAIDTACSSGLVALCRAVETLRRGESQLALVGGVNVLASRLPFQVFADAGMLSPEGLCRPFDDSAAGYVRGEGCACVVLKPAAAALRDGDRILAVIKGGAVRHSGRTNSLTAPNPEAQADIIVTAMREAGVDPASIGYVEAHGTGTALGDPIEIKGLKKAFARLHGERGRSSVAPHFHVGSVKAQIGHLEAAAGLAGLLKAVAALVHRTVPGSPYLTQLNRHIDLSDACFRVPREPTPWEASPGEVALPVGPRRAGVSSFGFGGVNSHVVLEEALPSTTGVAAETRARLFLLSARKAEALGALCTRLAEHVGTLSFPDEGSEQTYLEHLAFTLRQARTPMAHRLALVASSAAELVEKLCRHTRQGADTLDVFAGVARAEPHELAELFSDAAELMGRLRELATRGELRKLARLWTQGLSIDWEQVLPRGGASLVTLPGYPFARERFWVKPAAAEVSAPRAAPRQAGVAFYRPRWVPRPLPAAAPSQASGTLVALVAGERGRGVAEAVGRRASQRSLLVATLPVEGTAPQASAAELLARAGQVSAVLDLTPLDDAFHQDGPQVLRKLELLRHLVGGALKKGEPLELVQVTLGLQDLGQPGQAPSTLAGAQDSGFFKHLGAEYRRSRSKTVDLSLAALDAGQAAEWISRELEQHDGESEVAWLRGQRFARVMERATPAAARELAGEEGGAALITGGTGDIGLCLARDLVDRGFKALLLTGRRELSPEKRAVLQELERRGTAIFLYRGELDDAAGLRGAIEEVRASHGRLTHVFHCAGAVDRQTPAFFLKTAESMAAVMRPKVDALRILHELFEKEPPRAFVLFSSASAVAPRMASGVLDYAAANRFLDLFAHFQHANGRRYYRSIQWTRWQGMGLARGVGEATEGSEHSLAPEQCLEALHCLLGSGDALGPSVCVLAEGDPALRPAPEVPPQAAAAPPPVHPGPPDLDAIRRRVRSIVAREIESDESKLDDEASFEELGIDSIVLTGLVSQLEDWTGQKLDPTALIQCNSIAAVARYLAELLPPEAAPAQGASAPPEATPAPEASPLKAEPARPPAPVVRTELKDAQRVPAEQPAAGPFPVAIIGMACRFPGAPDKETFWRNLAAGADSVTTAPPTRWDVHSKYAPRYQPGKTVSKWGGFIDGIERVSPALFGMSAEDAADIDPLIRLFTECSLDAVLDAYPDRSALQGRRVGVFAGARAGQYAERIVLPGKQSVTGIGQNFVSAYVSHVLDLRGPSLVVDSACSSSLAAVHLACQSLRSGDSELAIAGGVDVLLDEKPYLLLSAAHALSPDGRCRTFDDKANGFVPGEGVGCVLLKPLDKALADGDPIYAIINGAAMNNDGHTLGITTPGVEGQVDVIERALRNASVSPRDISYVEAHGTGTMIGDPIELRALARAFAKEPPARCAIGSVKTNVGHLLSAAGIASLMKVALALHHRVLPPTLHCERVNPRFEFERTPFFPIREAQEWKATGSEPRRAGISSFGFGKTNVHVILSERPEAARRPQELEAARRAIPDSEKVFAWHPPRQLERVPADAALLALEEVTFEDSLREA